MTGWLVLIAAIVLYVGVGAFVVSRGDGSPGEET